MAWQVVRQDDNGNRYVVALLADEATAKALGDALEASAHKQLYEVVEVAPEAARGEPVLVPAR